MSPRQAAMRLKLAAWITRNVEMPKVPNRLPKDATCIAVDGRIFTGHDFDPDKPNVPFRLAIGGFGMTSDSEELWRARNAIAEMASKRPAQTRVGFA